MQPELSVIFPAYNEEKRISSTLKSYLGYMRKNFRNFEIIVVCDGSDGTENLAKKFGVQAIHSDRRLGKGGAVLAGVEKSRSRWVAFVDADNSVDAAEFSRIWKARRGADMLIGSRYSSAANSHGMPWARKALSAGFVFLVRALFGLQFSDTQCGAKLMDAEKLRPICRQMVSRGYVFDVELLARSRASSLRIKEIPIRWKMAPGSHIRFATPFRMALELAILRITMQFENLQHAWKG